MEKDTNSYRSILKGTSLFGGVQIFHILISLIRGKFVALFLGPAGMGISSLFNSAGLTLQQITGLGLNLGIVKEVAAQKESENFPHLLAAAKRILFIAAIIGALVCVMLSLPLSRLTFGSDEYAWQFMLLGGMIFFGVAGQGLMSVLQGLHALKLVSVTSICGALAGLLIGVPLYYFMGTKGIVPVMVIMSGTTCIAALIGVRKATNSPKIKFEKAVHNPIIRKLLMIGLVLVASDIIATGATYVLNLFIRYFGDIESLGLYQAANSITNQYSGVVFTAMMLDFFPRLSESAGDNDKVTLIVNRQLEIVALIACPLICLLILTSPLVISILLTSTFIPVMPLMRWLGLGVLIKALMYPLGYITLAKDNRKLFFWLEGVFCNLLTLVLNCLGYYFFGLIGLGFSLAVDCLICIGIYYVINHRLYGFTFTGKSAFEALMAVALTGLCFVFSFIENNVAAYVLMGAVTAITIVRSFVLLKRRLA